MLKDFGESTMSAFETKEGNLLLDQEEMENEIYEEVRDKFFASKSEIYSNREANTSKKQCKNVKFVLNLASICRNFQGYHS